MYRPESYKIRDLNMPGTVELFVYKMGSTKVFLAVCLPAARIVGAHS